MKRFIYSILGMATVISFVITPAIASAGPFDTARDNACQGLEFSEGDSKSCDSSDGTTINSKVSTIINLISLVVGLISVIMVIVGGLKYTTSRGDSGGISSAKDTILYAIIGLIIVALAQLMVRFVLNKTSDTSSSSSSSSSEPICAPGRPC